MKNKKIRPYRLTYYQISTNIQQNNIFTNCIALFRDFIIPLNTSHLHIHIYLNYL